MKIIAQYVNGRLRDHIVDNTWIKVPITSEYKNRDSFCIGTLDEDAIVPLPSEFKSSAPLLTLRNTYGESLLFINIDAEVGSYLYNDTGQLDLAEISEEEKQKRAESRKRKEQLKRKNRSAWDKCMKAVSAKDDPRCLEYYSESRIKAGYYS